MKTKALFGSLLLLALTTMVLSGCAGSDSNGSSTTTYHTFTSFVSFKKLVLPYGESGQWDAGSVAAPLVIKDFASGEYKMFYLDWLRPTIPVDPGRNMLVIRFLNLPLGLRTQML